MAAQSSMTAAGSVRCGVQSHDRLRNRNRHEVSDNSLVCVKIALSSQDAIDSKCSLSPVNTELTYSRVQSIEVVSHRNKTVVVAFSCDVLFTNEGDR